MHPANQPPDNQDEGAPTPSAVHGLGAPPPLDNPYVGIALAALFPELVNARVELETAVIASLDNPHGSTVARLSDVERFRLFRLTLGGPPPPPDRHVPRLSDGVDGLRSWLAEWPSARFVSGSMVTVLPTYVDVRGETGPWSDLRGDVVLLTITRCWAPAPWSGHPFVYVWCLASNGPNHDLGDVWLTGSARPTRTPCSATCPLEHARHGLADEGVAPEWGRS